MSTYAVGISAPTLSTASAQRARSARGLFGRIFDRMIEARMRQAELEVRRQLATLPPHFLERAGYILKNDRRL